MIANLATISPDGSPHVTPVWIDVEGDDLVMNTADGRAKVDNLRHRPCATDRRWRSRWSTLTTRIGCSPCKAW
ncbi:pyridoxamine 5'-phosphate oxidase family protein [Rhabdothermincola sediminis]|uniref:pyridoxamine 5'-phosphate oxidase family protein n=1 Tax=Rhabdothermincola sediminis TaxID=2751370 RepID=UPI001AA09B8A